MTNRPLVILLAVLVIALLTLSACRISSPCDKYNLACPSDNTPSPTAAPGTPDPVTPTATATPTPQAVATGQRGLP